MNEKVRDEDKGTFPLYKAQKPNPIQDLEIRVPNRPLIEGLLYSSP